MENLKYIITGTGRCGTGYMSKIFNRSRIPCGHESIFTHTGISLNKKLVADSSAFAVPYIKDFKNTNVTIIHIMRNPIKVLKSLLYHTTSFHIDEKINDINNKKNKSAIFLKKYYPEIFEYKNIIDKLIMFYYICNNKIYDDCYNNNIKYLFFKVEQNPNDLFDTLKENHVDYEDLTKYNTRDDNQIEDEQIISLLNTREIFSLIKPLIYKNYPNLINE